MTEYRDLPLSTRIVGGFGLVILSAYIIAVAYIWLIGDEAGRQAFVCGFKAFWGARGPDCWPH